MVSTLLLSPLCPDTDQAQYLHRVAAIFILILMIMIAQLFWVRPSFTSAYMHSNIAPGMRADASMARRSVTTVSPRQAGRDLPARE